MMIPVANILISPVGSHSWQKPFLGFFSLFYPHTLLFVTRSHGLDWNHTRPDQILGTWDLLGLS